MLSPEELRARADSLAWYHQIDLGQGVTTRGQSKGPFLTAEHMPDLAGRSVLDIGAWDGYYSFLAERLGAARVMALDHYVWGVDIAARQAYWDECADQGVLPDHDNIIANRAAPVEARILCTTSRFGSERLPPIL